MKKFGSFADVNADMERGVLSIIPFGMSLPKSPESGDVVVTVERGNEHPAVLEWDGDKWTRHDIDPESNQETLKELYFFVKTMRHGVPHTTPTGETYVMDPPDFNTPLVVRIKERVLVENAVLADSLQTIALDNLKQK